MVTQTFKHNDTSQTSDIRIIKVENMETVEVQPIVLDPDNDFEACLIKMVQTSRAKRKDYAGDDHPWQNFYDSAYQLTGTAGDSVETLIATKQARLRILLQAHRDHKLEGGPANEPVIDTLLDRAVYAVIAMCLWNEDGYNG